MANGKSGLSTSTNKEREKEIRDWHDQFLASYFVESP
jgi:hypothetical protein